MTVVAIGRGAQSYNAIVTDTRVGDPRGRMLTEDKVFPFGPDTFIAPMGKSALLIAAMTVAKWAQPQSLDLREAAVIDAILACARRTARALELHPEDYCWRLGVLVGCRRDSAFFWTITEGARERTDVETGVFRILYGGHSPPFYGEMSEDTENPLGLLAMAIRWVHEQDYKKPEADRWLPYPLDGTFSGVFMPHDPAQQWGRTEERPSDLPAFGDKKRFASLLHEFASKGGKAEKALPEDQEFMDCPEFKRIGI